MSYVDVEYGGGGSTEPEYGVDLTTTSWSGSVTIQTTKKVKKFILFFHTSSYAGVAWNTDDTHVDLLYGGTHTENWSTCIISNNSITINDSPSSSSRTIQAKFYIYE